MKKPVILCVDNDKTVLVSLLAQLRKRLGARFDCMSAKSADECLAICTELTKNHREIAVVLAEQQLPDVKGELLLAKIEELYPDARKVLLSAAADAELLPRAMAAFELYGFFNKPWDEDLLCKKVEKAAYAFLHNFEVQEHSRLFRSLNKATQEISSEIDLQRINQKLMQYVIDNTQADRAFLLFAQQGRLVVEAVSSTDKNEAKNLRQRLANEPVALNEEAMNLVTEALQREQFPDHKVVIPIYKKGKNVAYLYLENNDSNNLFTHNQYEVLQALCSQAAISMENAGLYAQLEKRSRELQEEKERVEENEAIIELKNRDINDTWSYAHSVQQAALQPEKTMRGYFPDSFILFQPQSEVSGDFYWFAERYYKFMIGLVDFPGMGVPGAFVSLIVSNLLNEITNEFAVLEPDVALEHLNIRLGQSFHDQNNAVNPQMRIAFCIYDHADQTLQFAGAGRSIIVGRGGKLYEIPGVDSVLDAGAGNFLGVQTHTVQLETDDVLYVYSDGFLNQFQSEEQPALLRFLNLLEEIQHLPMQDQKKKIQQTFKNWMGEDKQIDDFLLIGLRFSNFVE